MNEDQEPNQTPNEHDIVTIHECLSCGRHFSAGDAADIERGKAERPLCNAYRYTRPCMIETITITLLS